MKTNYMFFPLRTDGTQVGSSALIRKQFNDALAAGAYADRMLVDHPEYRKILVTTVQLAFSRRR